MDAERRIALAKLTVPEYDAILNHCNSNIFVTDGQGRILYANDAAERALNCPFDRLRQMDIYQLQAEGYTSRSSTAEAIQTKQKVFSVYQNNKGEEIATTSIPVLGFGGEIELVVTHSDEVGALLAQQKEMERYRMLLGSLIDRSGNAAPQMIARDPAMTQLIRSLEKYAASDATILLYGESGTGKEVMANHIQRRSLRQEQIFLSINCAAIPGELIESELFGYERGAFTGANKEGKPGIFELADGGTIFLDEVGELSTVAQSKLLRVLESGEFMRVGGQKTLKTDVRILAATNRDLREMVEEKSFRADLYYRLSVVPVTIPPLRERPLDIDAIAQFFLDTFNRKNRVERVMSDHMQAQLRAYPWPGNIRELRNVMENYVITGEEPTLLPGAQPTQAQFTASQMPTDAEASLREVVGSAERAHILATLRACNGDVSQTAQRLGIHRSVLYKKISKYELRK